MACCLIVFAARNSSTRSHHKIQLYDTSEVIFDITVNLSHHLNNDRGIDRNSQLQTNKWVDPVSNAQTIE